MTELVNAFVSKYAFIGLVKKKRSGIFISYNKCRKRHERKQLLRK
jgi:hypothetical protein